MLGIRSLRIAISGAAARSGIDQYNQKYRHRSKIQWGDGSESGLTPAGLKKGLNFRAALLEIHEGSGPGIGVVARFRPGYG